MQEIFIATLFLGPKITNSHYIMKCNIAEKMSKCTCSKNKSYVHNVETFTKVQVTLLPKVILICVSFFMKFRIKTNNTLLRDISKCDKFICESYCYCYYYYYILNSG